MKLATVLVVLGIAAAVVAQDRFILKELPPVSLEERVAWLEKEVYLLKRCDFEYEDDAETCFGLPSQHVDRCLHNAMDTWEDCERPSPF